MYDIKKKSKYSSYFEVKTCKFTMKYLISNLNGFKKKIIKM